MVAVENAKSNATILSIRYKGSYTRAGNRDYFTLANGNRVDITGLGLMEAGRRIEQAQQQYSTTTNPYDAEVKHYESLYNKLMAEIKLAHELESQGEVSRRDFNKQLFVFEAHYGKDENNWTLEQINKHKYITEGYDAADDQVKDARQTIITDGLRAACTALKSGSARLGQLFYNFQNRQSA